MEQVAGGVILDTDILIDFLNNREPGVSLVSYLIEAELSLTTVISAYELWAGAKGIGLRKKLDALFEDIFCLPLTLRAAKAAGEIALRLKRKGSEIGPGDSLIAGICLSHGLPLITRNIGHFQRIEGLQVLSPQDFIPK